MVIAFTWLVFSAGYYGVLHALVTFCVEIEYSPSDWFWHVSVGLFHQFWILPSIFIAFLILIKDRHMNESQSKRWNKAFAVLCLIIGGLGVFTVWEAITVMDSVN